MRPPLAVQQPRCSTQAACPAGATATALRDPATAQLSRPPTANPINPTRSTREELSFDAFLEQLGKLQDGYRAVRQQQGATADDYWRVLREWDRVQLFWFVPLRSMWKVQYHW